MYSFWQRIGNATSFFSSCLCVALPLVALLNFFLQAPVPPVSLEIENMVNKVGVEDYFVNQRVTLTDVKFNVNAGIGLQDHGHV
jgi:hypothetical protein